MPSRSRYTLLIPTYNRPDHLRRLLGYTPDALSYVRISPTSYGAAGSRSSAQLEVLRSWLELTRRPGWERRRAALVAAAVWPDYRLRAVRALSKIPAMSRFDWQGGSFGCRSGPSWHRFSVLAFAAGSVPSGHSIVAGYGTCIEVAVFAHGVAPDTVGLPASSNSALELGASLGHYHAPGRLRVGAGQVIAPVGDFGSKQA